MCKIVVIISPPNIAREVQPNAMREEGTIVVVNNPYRPSPPLYISSIYFCFISRVTTSSKSYQLFTCFHSSFPYTVPLLASIRMLCKQRISSDLMDYPSQNTFKEANEKCCGKKAQHSHTVIDSYP